jgi:hypothetical protein
MSPAVIAVGKAAIVRAILFAERHSHIFVDQSNARNGLEIDRIHSTWLVKLMQVLGPDRKVADVERVFEDLSFIVFNYDRCIEHFLAYALQLLYGVEREVAEAIVGRADIIHPYGSVGDLDRVPFGGPGYGRPDYFTLGQGIKTYTEQVEENATLDKIAHSMERAECVVFLGFAYHKQNMRLLFRSHKRPRKMVQVYGTAFGMSDADKEHVVDELNAYFGEVETEPGAIARGLSNIHIENKLGCTQLFDYYAKSLAG